ncbi:hypothetical protein [Haloarchaeobius amylolyticus]|uniref:hypothetical protein n=1 Tax=Haloarchaeobius amylolyticus TaxID=1198296 RepID=UPI002271AE9F|nr:hypothetical protein [Haloarchaeobius amylolyticus]
MDQRAQVSVGIIFLFIAMVAVAAIAGGTLLSGAGQLSAEAENETAAAFEDISGGVLVVNEVGKVDAADGSVGTARLTVKLGAGMNRTDLSNATIHYRGEHVNRTLNFTAAEANATNFSVVSPIDHDGSAPVLNSETDVFHVVVAVEDIRAGSEAATAGLGAQDRAVLVITTERGIVTRSVLTVPQSMEEKEWVPL